MLGRGFAHDSLIEAGQTIACLEEIAYNKEKVLDMAKPLLKNGQYLLNG